VLTQQCRSARSTAVDDVATYSRLVTKSAATTTVDVRQYYRNRFYCSTFLNLRSWWSMNIRVVATQWRR